MKIIIPTCDKYRNILEAQKYTLDKFGGVNLDVTILGYKQPDFNVNNWKFVSLGVDMGAKNFTNDISKFFNDFNDEYFIYGNDDIVAVNTLNLKLLDDMENIMKNNSNVMKICVTSAAQSVYKNHSVFENKNGFQYIQLPQNAEYRLSLHYGIWRSLYFKKYFQLGISPWDWELRNVAKNDGAVILGTTGQYFLDFGHILRKGGIITNNWYMSEYTGKTLPMEDINYITHILRKL